MAGTWRLSFLALIGIVSLTLLLSLFSADFMETSADETTLAWQAKQALAHVPYRDYFAFKPPLALYSITWAFAVFGTHLSVLRFLTLAALTGSTVLLYLLLIRERVPSWWATAAALMLPA